MIGTWCSVELKEALRLGYEIVEVYEAIVWNKQSRHLFTDFLKFGIMNKIYSSDVKKWEKDEFVKENAIGELPFPEIGQDWNLPNDNTYHFKCDLEKQLFKIMLDTSIPLTALVLSLNFQRSAREKV